MRKLFALLMALTMTFQLVTPAWADAVEEPEEPLATVEAAEETEEPNEDTEVPTEETEAPTEGTEVPAEEAEAETTDKTVEEPS